MALICSPITLTWYPGALGVTTSPTVLLTATTDLIDHASPWGATHGQRIDTAEYVRGAQPYFFSRGQNTSRREWTKYVTAANPLTAIATAEAWLATLPTETGWLRIQNAGGGTQYSIDHCAIAEKSYAWQPKTQRIAYTLQLTGGAMAVYTP